mgnify:CR=1 FL=1
METLPRRFISNLFDLPLNGPEGLQKQAYSYDYGDVHFSVIDTQQEELNEWQPELIASQVSWLERDLAAMADATVYLSKDGE